VQDSFTETKISEWFDEQGGSVFYKTATPTHITLDVFQACAAKHPPSTADIPGVPENMAKSIVFAVRSVLIPNHHPPGDMGMEIVNGEIVSKKNWNQHVVVGWSSRAKCGKGSAF
jgi:hypothetical protein